MIVKLAILIDITISDTCRILLTPITNDNKVEGIVGINIDITDRKLAEHALKESEKKFRELFEANTDGITIFRINPDGLPLIILDSNGICSGDAGVQKRKN